MSKIMSISNKFKNTLDNLINSLNNNSNIKTLAESREIYILNNNILSLGKRERNLDKKRDFLKNRSQRH